MAARTSATLSCCATAAAAAEWATTATTGPPRPWRCTSSRPPSPSRSTLPPNTRSRTLDASPSSSRRKTAVAVRASYLVRRTRSASSDGSASATPSMASASGAGTASTTASNVARAGVAMPSPSRCAAATTNVASRSRPSTRRPKCTASGRASASRAAHTSLSDPTAAYWRQSSGQSRRSSVGASCSSPTGSTRPRAASA
mmetsp:Transcript_1295/g.3861  ORF Transcript_1295/g.3861 Transcript_1295/m.3861 type:complete len:200 (-) Transcript_1295:34-633(-)